MNKKDFDEYLDNMSNILVDVKENVLLTNSILTKQTEKLENMSNNICDIHDNLENTNKNINKIIKKDNNIIYNGIIIGTIVSGVTIGSIGIIFGNIPIIASSATVLLTTAMTLGFKKLW